MPELPEVETMRRSVLGAEGGTVIRLGPARCRKRPLKMNASWRTLQRALTGKRLQAVERLGKRLIFRFSDGPILMIEPRMSGLLVGAATVSRASLRFEIHLRDCSCPRIAYWDQRGLGQVFLFDEKGLENYLSRERVGSDALAIGSRELRQMLEHRKTPIKVALLDQKAVAGIGNIYASEILNAARIDPRRRCCDVSPDEWRTIHRRMREILREAIGHKGSTLRDGTYRRSTRKTGNFQKLHRVYARGGKPCLRCRQGVIERIVQAQRSTWFCSACQK